MPDNYNPGTLPSLTMVYGTGEEYKAGGTVAGAGRRRLGSGGNILRDYTVFVSRVVHSFVFISADICVLYLMLMSYLSLSLVLP